MGEGSPVAVSLCTTATALIFFSVSACSSTAHDLGNPSTILLSKVTLLTLWVRCATAILVKMLWRSTQAGSIYFKSAFRCQCICVCVYTGKESGRNACVSRSYNLSLRTKAVYCDSRATVVL